MSENKKRIFSGIQPSGKITIGNYYGAIKNWLTLQYDYECIFSVVDLHAITVRQVPADLRRQSRELLALYIACGLDPEHNIIYPQSHVSGHTELSWILNCFTYMGELSRMTQFKDKSAKHADNINAGLFDYPVLMAADILLYQADLVPIGADQKQHLELTRDIATRFNGQYSETFKVPEAYYGKVGARIMSLADPTAKMSKSDANPKGYITILDEPNIIKNKIKSAVTDSVGIINYTTEQPGVKNLIDIYCCATSKTVEEAMVQFEGQNYGYLKNTVANALVEDLEPIQTKFKELVKNKEYIDNIVKVNSEKANYLAMKTLRKVKKKVGFII